MTFIKSPPSILRFSHILLFAIYIFQSVSYIFIINYSNPLQKNVRYMHTGTHNLLPFSHVNSQKGVGLSHLNL